jgi:hypothetical protein
MIAVQERTIGSKVTFFLARDHFFNLVRKPGRIATIQGCAPSGYIGDRVGVRLINRTRTGHTVSRDDDRAA